MRIDRRLLLIFTCVICVCVGGCGKTDNYIENTPSTESKNDSGEKDELPVSLGLEPTFDYEIPQIKTSIKIDQAGYEPSDLKMVVFEGEDLPDNFVVVDASTKDVVFEGKIEKKGTNEAYGKSLGYGDFSAVCTEGKYCVRAEKIGYSYPFLIKDDIDAPFLTDAMKQYYYSRCGTSLTAEFAADDARNACHTSLAKMQEDMKVEIDVSGGWHVDEKGNRYVITGCEAMQNLLLAYELNKEVFSDEQEIPESGDGIPDVLNELQYEAAWLLKMQDPVTGGIYEGVRTTDYGNGSSYSYVQAISLEASVSYAAAMAKFSYVYQTHDTAFATLCLKAADRAYRYAEHYPEECSPEELFQAATELYRATGYLTYRLAAEAYIRELQTIDMSNDNLFEGCVTYLFTKQKVDTGLCENVISQLMDYVEALSYENRSAAYLAGRREGQEIPQMLRDACRVAVVNYVITNNEYDRILESYLHYFLGCNEEAMCYVGMLGQNNAVDIPGAVSIMNQAENDSYWILLLSSTNKN